jgi:hypothetical protein
LCRTNSIKFFFLLQKVCIIDGKLTLKIEHVDNTVRKAFYVYLLLDHSKLYVFMSQDRLWKEILTTDRQQVHQFQQNEQSLLILTHWTHTIKKTMTYNIGNPAPGLGQAQKCGRVKLF